MTLQEWFDNVKGRENEIIDDDELRDAVEVYVEAYSELVHILHQRGFEIDD